MSMRSIASNFSIQAAGKVLSVLIGLAALAIITRALGPEQFGEYTTAITFVQLFAVVVDFGLTLTLVVMISEKDADEQRLVGNLVVLRLLSGVVFFGLAPIVALSFPWSDTVKMGIAVAAAAYLFMSSAGMLTGIFQKHAVMWRAAFAEIITRALMLALIAWAAFAGMGVVGLIAVTIVSNFLWYALMIVLARPFVKIRPRWEPRIWRTAFARSWPIAVSIFFNLLYLKGDILFLAWFRNQTEVGWYGLSYRVLDAVTTLPVMFMGIVLPGLVADFSGGDKATFARKMGKIFDLFILVILPVIIGTQAIASELIRLIAGAGYEVSAGVLKLLIVATAGVFLGALYGHAVLAVNKQRVMTWGYIATAIVAITGYVLFIPTYGMWAAAWVTVISEIMITLWAFVVVYRASGTRPTLLVSAKALLAAALMYGALVVMPEVWHVLIRIVGAALVYAGGLILLKAVDLHKMQLMITLRTRSDEK